MTVQAASSSLGIAGGTDRPTTFHGADPDKAAETTISASTPTKCQARTRLYRDGVLELEGFPITDIGEHFKAPATVVWLDLRDPDREDLDDWAAIIAVPTFVTGLYGMNVPYPGFGRAWGVGASFLIMVVLAAVLYVAFRRNDWL